ncbi:hypothetical protein EJ03DRAFT_37221 [Teratosphaeria nubilosa]|uniref:Uncharacterized protein n=1 Tax=Teratosphaeria nubilosa TaxID=161662 RepID=A0A6G1LFN5_9PEZI|nr:hypothetical protein EJ03DRAFT_37221 [Teratosphaeria nubilosa]
MYDRHAAVAAAALFHPLMHTAFGFAPSLSLPRRQPSSVRPPAHPFIAPRISSSHDDSSQPESRDARPHSIVSAHSSTLRIPRPHKCVTALRLLYRGSARPPRKYPSLQRH